MRSAVALAALLTLSACGSSTGSPQEGLATRPPVQADPPPGPMPAPVAEPPAATPVFAGCPVFPPGDPWNTEVGAAALDPRAEALAALMSPEAPLRLALGTTEPHFGQPIVVVPPDQPLVPISFGAGGEDYSGESDHGPFPIPLDAPIQGGSPDAPDPVSGDRHLIVVQRETCRLFELYKAERVPGGFRVSSAATFDLRVGARRPHGFTSADAAGLPILPGLLRYEELEAGVVLHALRVTLPRGGGTFVAPANHCVASLLADPPFGTRVRLRADFDESPYGPTTRVLLRALKRYGLVFADIGTAWSLSGVSDPRFAPILRELRERPIPGRAFEVVELGPVVTGC